MALSFFIVFFQRYAIAVIADDLSGAMGLTGTHLSNLGSMYFYAYAFMQIPFGLLLDSWGPRRVSSLGMFLAALGSLLFSMSSTLYMSYLARILVGVGTAPILISVLKFQSLWFPKELFSTITGITSVVGNLGALSATTPLALMVIAVGWRSSFRLLAMISMVLMVLLYFMVRDYPESKDVEGVSKEKKGGGINYTALKKVLLNPYTWPNFIIFFGGLGVIMSFSGLWGVPFLMHTLDLSRDVAANQILIYTIGVIFGSPLWGFLADRLKALVLVLRTCIGITLLLWFLFISLLSKATPLWVFTLLFFFMGFFGIAVLFSFTAAKEVNLPQYAGTSTSVVNVAPFLGTSVLNLLVGWRLDLNWEGQLIEGVRIYSMVGYREGFIIYLFALLAAFFMSFLVKDRMVQERTSTLKASH